MHASVEASACGVDELIPHDRLHGAIETSLLGGIDKKRGRRRGCSGVLRTRPSNMAHELEMTSVSWILNFGDGTGKLGNRRGKARRRFNFRIT